MSTLTLSLSLSLSLFHLTGFSQSHQMPRYAPFTVLHVCLVVCLCVFGKCTVCVCVRVRVPVHVRACVCTIISYWFRIRGNQRRYVAHRITHGVPTSPRTEDTSFKKGPQNHWKVIGFVHQCYVIQVNMCVYHGTSSLQKFVFLQVFYNMYENKTGWKTSSCLFYILTSVPIFILLIIVKQDKIRPCGLHTPRAIITSVPITAHKHKKYTHRLVKGVCW